MIINSFMIDPSLKQYREMKEAIDKTSMDIYDEDNNDTISEDKALWNKNYLVEQMADLLTNFSQRRLDIIEKITKYVYSEYQINNVKNIKSTKDIANKHMTNKKYSQGKDIFSEVERGIKKGIKILFTPKKQ